MSPASQLSSLPDRTPTKKSHGRIQPHDLSNEHGTWHVWPCDARRHATTVLSSRLHHSTGTDAESLLDSCAGRGAEGITGDPRIWQPTCESTTEAVAWSCDPAPAAFSLTHLQELGSKALSIALLPPLLAVVEEAARGKPGVVSNRAFGAPDARKVIAHGTPVRCRGIFHDEGRSAGTRRRTRRTSTQTTFVSWDQPVLLVPLTRLRVALSNSPNRLKTL